MWVSRRKYQGSDDGGGLMNGHYCVRAVVGRSTDDEKGVKAMMTKSPAEAHRPTTKTTYSRLRYGGRMKAPRLERPLQQLACFRPVRASSAACLPLHHPPVTPPQNTPLPSHQISGELPDSTLPWESGLSLEVLRLLPWYQMFQHGLQPASFQLVSSFTCTTILGCQPPFLFFSSPLILPFPPPFQ